MTSWKIEMSGVIGFNSKAVAKRFKYLKHIK